MWLVAFVSVTVASTAAAQHGSSPRPLMVSRAQKQHNDNWHDKAPLGVPQIDGGTRPPMTNPCWSCPEECCAGSCTCINSGGTPPNPCGECPDSCCGARCCPPPAPPAACAACDANQCCGDACKSRVCTAADAPGQCDRDQTACENGCCPADHPFCCGSGEAPFCGATADCGADVSRDGGQAARVAGPHHSGCSMASDVPAPWGMLSLVAMLAGLMRGRRRGARGSWHLAMNRLARLRGRSVASRRLFAGEADGGDDRAAAAVDDRA